ncbi:MAG TPA: beta-galactosidase [Phycisphaerae bacterium]|nr:beta-galactosidase [Phycisphaerae bacterium]
MPTVRYDDRSLIVDEERIWLASGSVHYFRVPRDLWRDRLLKAKRAGLNCIQTYVAWNLHEPEQGKWDFSGDLDLREFIGQAAELGLYVILRPGPYICAEWDFGGFPAYLAAKSNLAYRTANAAFMHYFDKFLAQVLVRLADLQVTRGGNIILVQNENEYYYTTMPDRLAYLQFISQLIRRAGFEVPIITCNLLSEPLLPEAVECMNCWGNEVQTAKRLRQVQPEAFMLATEFWAGWFDYWGGKHQVRDAREVARRALEIMGCGCQVNYYMWHGGTNFGFWGSRLSAHDWSYQTTSYDYDAPLAEGGGLTRKYYLTKLVNMLGSHFGPFFAQGRMEGGPSVTVHNGTQVLNVAGPVGRMAVVTNNGRDEVTTADISLPDGRALTVPLEPLGATAVPVGVRLGPETVLDYANLMPLGVFGDGLLVLHGPAGWDGRLSINGKELTAKVPADDKPVELAEAGQKVLILNSDAATRTWEVDETLVIGPEFVGATVEDVTAGAGLRQYTLVGPEAKCSVRKVRAAGKKPPAPRLGQFSRLCVCDEPINPHLPWQKLDRPKDLAAMEIKHGYAWQRAVVDSPRAMTRHLFLPCCEDRATIYANGKLINVWGRGPGAERTPISVPFRRGANELTFLLDNMGRVNFGPKLGQPKGLFGQVWDAKPLLLKKFKLRAGGDFSRRMLPRMMVHMFPSLSNTPMVTAEVSFPLPRITPVHLSYRNLNHHMIVLCNGRQAGFLPDSGGYGDITLGNELKKGTNHLQLLLWGDVRPKDLDSIRLYLLMESVTDNAEWSYRRWEVPPVPGRVVGKGLPAWYRSAFKHSGSPVPLFLRISGARKGQIYLNGRNVGRFWNIGPQEYYYLPEPWLGAENELLIFEEQGNTPSGSKLEYRPGGPYG